MNFDFQAILLIVTLFSGVVWLLDALFWAKKRQLRSGEKGQKDKMPILIEYSRSFFPILFIVLILRSFLVEPFRIPSGSMEPTLYPGDFILVNKFRYGVRLPLLGTEIISVDNPKRGEVLVFRYPKNPELDYIKRVVGLPGDEILIRGQSIWINGERIQQTDAGLYTGWDSRLQKEQARTMNETLGDIHHEIAVAKDGGVLRGRELRRRVPEGHYFVMGDNRDNSNDSRFWGFVPQENLVGKAFMIWMSWDTEDNTVLWRRIGIKI